MRKVFVIVISEPRIEHVSVVGPFSSRKEARLAYFAFDDSLSDKRRRDIVANIVEVRSPGSLLSVKELMSRRTDK